MRAVRLSLPAFALLLVTFTLSAQTLPANPQPTCVATSQLFNSWFQSGSVSLDGVVNPANSITLSTANNCNFYLWSQQMLLWLLSPAPASYGGSGRVFDSPVFYQVTTANANGKRYFIPNLPLTPNADLKTRARRVGLRPSKPGPNGLPAVVDRQGNVIELLAQQTGPSRKPVLFNQAGTKVEVGKVTIGENDRAIFHDAAGKVIPQPKLVVPAKLKNARVGQRFFTADLVPIIVGPTGIIFDVDPAQAGGNAVLLAKNNTAVFYSIVANDVYAYFASGVNSGKISSNAFPTTQAQLNTIQQYAGQVFPDGIALAVEVKLSWVDISAVSNPSAYITTPAFVPVYSVNQANTQWTQTGEKLTTLALVGVHFVGSAQGHPEMIWSTFEHFGNSPNGAYQYVNTSGATVSVPASSAGSWLFSKSNSSGPFNQLHATYNSTSAPPTINAEPNFTINASDTQRVNAFGVFPGRVPNQQDATPAAANTEIISINNSVLGQLASGDVRGNYYFVGSTWTFGGYAPTGPYPNASGNNNGAEIGTNQLANSTMETYHQGTSTAPGLNCFTCHTGSSTAPSTPATTVVSHIFSQMQPIGSTPAAAATAKPKARLKKQ